MALSTPSHNRRVTSLTDVWATYQRLPRPLLDANHPDGVGGHERSRRRGVAVHCGQRTFITLRSHLVVSLYQRLTAKKGERVSHLERTADMNEGTTPNSSSTQRSYICLRPVSISTRKVSSQYCSSSTSPNRTLDSYWSRRAQPAPSCSACT